MKNIFLIKWLVIITLFSVTDISKAEGHKVNCRSALPPGSFQHQLAYGECKGKKADCITKKVQVIDRGKSGRTLVYGNSYIEDVDHYVQHDFDIIIVGNTLGLKPGKTIYLNPEKELTGELANTAEKCTEGKKVYWPEFPASLPDTCKNEKTSVKPEYQILETACKNRSGNSVEVFLPYYKQYIRPDYDYLENSNGYLRRLTYNSGFLYDLYLKLTFSLGYMHDLETQCKAVGGELKYLQKSGFYICEDSLPVNLELPEGHILLGYDVLLNVLMTYSVQLTAGIDGLQGNIHLHALPDPKKCLRHGLTINESGSHLYCTQPHKVPYGG